MHCLSFLRGIVRQVDTVTAPGPPLADNGEPHLLETGIPRADVTDVLVDLRLQLLTEMEEFAGRTASDSKEWATVEVEEVTEELDENLRKHRPRAGYAPVHTTENSDNIE
jgi:hypothetical protein